MEIDPLLFNYANDLQKTKLQAVVDHGSYRKAAAAIGSSYSSVLAAVNRVKRNAAKMGYSPDHDMMNTVPEGFAVKGVSTLYDDAGNVKVQWVKSHADAERQETLLKMLAESLSEDVRGLSRVVDPPVDVDKDLLAGYPLPEPHFGMFSWGKETGDDYDCAVAADVLYSGMKNLVASAPPAETAIISNLGDWFHTDTTDNKTAKAGNQLDIDSRWPRVVKLGIEVLRGLVELALEKHKQIEIIGVGGNHDPHTSYMIALVIDAYFSNNDRVHVDLGPGSFKYYTFGKNLIGINHGDMAKPADLPLIMANDCPEWSKAEFRVWWTAHVHHLTRKEYTGCTVESFRSVAAKDSWHHQSGYRAGRDAQCVVFHRDRGEVQRITVAV